MRKLAEKVRAVDAWLFAPGDARALAAVRIGMAAILAWRTARPVYLELAGQPEVLFRPLSFMRALDQMPPREVVLVVQIVGVAAALAAAAGIRSRVSFPVAWLAALFLGGMFNSIGKIQHNDVVPLLVCVPLLFAALDDSWSLERRPARATPEAHGWPVRAALVVAVGAYFFAGFQKLVESGLAWVTSGNMRWILYNGSDQRMDPNELALFIADRAWLATALAAGTLILELGMPAVLWVRRAAWVLVPGAIAMHVMIWLTMGLDYWPWIATLLVLFPGVALARLSASAKTT